MAKSSFKLSNPLEARMAEATRIRENPANKRDIFWDAKLNQIFDGNDKVGFLEIMKLLSPHFVKTARKD